jgi:hypothetical protein
MVSCRPGRGQGSGHTHVHCFTVSLSQRYESTPRGGPVCARIRGRLFTGPRLTGPWTALYPCLIHRCFLSYCLCQDHGWSYEGGEKWERWWWEWKALKWEGFDAALKEVFSLHSFCLDVCFGGRRAGESGFSCYLGQFKNKYLQCNVNMLQVLLFTMNTVTVWISNSAELFSVLASSFSTSDLTVCLRKYRSSSSKAGVWELHLVDAISNLLLRFLLFILGVVNSPCKTWLFSCRISSSPTRSRTTNRKHKWEERWLNTNMAENTLLPRFHSVGVTRSVFVFCLLWSFHSLGDCCGSF